MQGSINFDGSLVGNITGGGGGGGDTVVITPVVTSGTKIADVSVNGVEKDLYCPTPPTPPEVEITPVVSSGTKIADVSVNGVEKDLYCPTPPTPPEVDITPVVTSGTKIADVSVNGVEKDLYCPTPPTPPEVDITPVVTSGTKIADVSIGGVEKNLYAPDYGADITALDDRLDTAEDNITSLTGRVVTAEGNISSLTGRVRTAEGNISSLTGKVRTAEGNITNLSGRMTEAENDITALGIECDAIVADLAAPYDEEETYSVGDYCTHDKVLYICTTNISTSEEWDISHWDAVKVTEDISEIKQSLSNLGIVTQTVVSENSINTVQSNVYGTLLSRKFSDYSLLIFMVLNTDNDMRGTSIIPTSLWTTDKQISINALHGTASADAKDFKVSTVTFKYASDSGVHIWTANNGAFTRIRIIGIKLG